MLTNLASTAKLTKTQITVKMKSMTATQAELQQFSMVAGLTLQNVRVDLYNTQRDGITKGRISLDNNLCHIYLPIVRFHTHENFQLDTEQCDKWKDIVKFNSCIMQTEQGYSRIQNDITGTCKQTLGGILEFKLNNINTIIGTLLTSILKRLPMIDNTQGEDLSQYH